MKRVSPFGQESEVSIWHEVGHEFTEIIKKEALSEQQLVSAAHLTLSSIVRRAHVYLACIDEAVSKGNARIAYDMIRLIFALIPQKARDEIMSMSPEEARDLMQSALKAVSPKEPAPPSGLLSKPDLTP